MSVVISSLILKQLSAGTEPAVKHYELIALIARVNHPLTSQVLGGGGHSAPLEEGVRVGVHHQQPGLVTACLNGSDDL